MASHAFDMPAFLVLNESEQHQRRLCWTCNIATPHTQPLRMSSSFTAPLSLDIYRSRHPRLRSRTTVFVCLLPVSQPKTPNGFYSTNSLRKGSPTSIADRHVFEAFIHPNPWTHWAYLALQHAFVRRNHTSLVGLIASFLSSHLRH